ncbi:MAG: hypothetical protein GF390_02820 [Candidatus Pacebacteria bacterium]|nr:hypothetical protein [Candidatus Paceibacterota bacterium]
MHKWFLPAVIMVFAGLSLLTLNSLTPDLVWRQLLFFLSGLGIFFILSKLDFFYWQKLSWPAYVILNLALLTLLLVGQTTRGITAWFVLPAGFKIQPSQLAIPLTLLTLIKFWQPQKAGQDWPHLLQLLSILLLPAGLIFLEPDLGTVLVFLIATGTVILFQASLKQLLSLLGVASMLLFVMGLFFLAPYQQQRLTSFFNPQTDSTNAGYNARQALIAVGSGQLWGRGLGFGVQSHLKFLPERQTDFIFASFAEEWGFVGTSLLVGLYLALLLFLLWQGWQLTALKKTVLVYGVMMMFCCQIIINIGMNLGLLPITGITLPLLSYGGSSLWSMMFSLGLVQRLLIEKQL